MKGFDYRTQTEFDRPTAQLREELQTIVNEGGFRRAEHGETFAHGKDGLIIWEAYGFVPLKQNRPAAQSTLELCARAHPDDVEGYADNA